MLQKNFDVHQGKISDDILRMEIGEKHIVLTASDNNIVNRNIEYYSFDNSDNFENVFTQIYQQSNFLKHDYKNVKLIWENIYAQYVPAKFYTDSSKDAYYSFIEKSLQKQKELVIKNESFAVPYCVNESIHNLLYKEFPNAKGSHKYFEIIDNLSVETDDGKLYLLTIFYPNHFIIVASQNNKLQFISSVKFSSGTDVVYYLLNAVKQLDTNISETLVTLSGLIDGDSSLFREIYKYIPNIDVDSAENATFLKENFSEHPSHFFVPFFKYA